MNLFKSTLIATALVVAGFAGNANAANLTDTFEVKIKILETCSVLTASDIDFGSTIPTAGGQIDRTGTINVQCTNGTDYTLALNGGGGSDTAARRMVGPGASTIGYQLFQDTGRSSVWGTVADGEQVDGVGNGLGTTYQNSHTVYARAFLVGNEPAGDYTDTVTATLTF
jgi:spore coat protein U-like protein